MFRARTLELSGKADEAKEQEARAFGQMREGLLEQAYHRQSPKLSVYSDQIVWGRSPVRIDLAGGWTDTPPYCLNEGGNVINLAITLNGQNNTVSSYVPSIWEPWKRLPPTKSCAISTW